MSIYHTRRIYIFCLDMHIFVGMCTVIPTSIRISSKNYRQLSVAHVSNTKRFPAPRPYQFSAAERLLAKNWWFARTLERLAWSAVGYPPWPSPSRHYKAANSLEVSDALGNTRKHAEGGRSQI